MGNELKWLLKEEGWYIAKRRICLPHMQLHGLAL